MPLISVHPAVKGTWVGSSTTSPTSSKRLGTTTFPLAATGTVSSFPHEIFATVGPCLRLVDEMLRRGIPGDSIKKFLGDNFLRVVKQVRG